jgi:hypothetical protein
LLVKIILVFCNCNEQVSAVLSADWVGHVFGILVWVEARALDCARGEAENRIKEAQLDLFGQNASCHKFQANQLRLLLAGMAYTLMIKLRRLALQGAEHVRACTATIRVKRLKIGAAVRRNTRRVRVLLASQHPFKHVFLSVARAMAP